MKFCSDCGATLTITIPEGDNLERFCCGRCGAIHYTNPKVVVGCIAEWQNKILLCLRDIEPRRNTWTLPAGYLENGESMEMGARRETYEESRARLETLTPYLLVDLVHINQVYMMFRCSLQNCEFEPTRESKEVRLFNEQEIPWDELAFPVITTALRNYFQDRAKGSFEFKNLSYSG